MNPDGTLVVPDFSGDPLRLAAEMLPALQVLTQDNPQVRGYAQQLTSAGVCPFYALAGGQLADALAQRQLPPQAEFWLPKAHSDCAAEAAATAISALLAAQGLPAVPVRPLARRALGKPSAGLVNLAPQLVGALCCGDLLDALTLQARVTAVRPADADECAARWRRQLPAQCSVSLLRLRSSLRPLFSAMVQDFSALPTKAVPTRHIGILGQPFLRLSPLLRDALFAAMATKGCVPVFCGASDFLLAQADGLHESGLSAPMLLAARTARSTLASLRAELSAAAQGSRFVLPPPVAPGENPEVAALVARGVRTLWLLRALPCGTQTTPSPARLQAAYPACRFSCLTLSVAATPAQLRQKVTLLLEET